MSSDDLKKDLLDVASVSADEVEELGKKTLDLLMDDGKDILDATKDSAAPRAKELSKEAFDWNLKAFKEKDEEKKARYEHEATVARARLATALIDEKLVATTAARDTFMARFDEFLKGALAILVKALELGVKVAATSLTGAFGGAGSAAVNLILKKL